jgi:murein DD-endopeptidase MepM/ murein hydrolase activator NlpD
MKRKYKFLQNIFITILFTVIFFQKSFAIPWPFSPTDQAHEIIATYGEFQQYLDGEDYTATQTLYAYFHNGIDIYKKDRPEVLSVTSGKVVGCYEDGYYYSKIGILTDGSTDEGWIYGHIVEHKVSLNQQVNVKQPIGRVAEYPDGGEWHHLHFIEKRGRVHLRRSLHFLTD